MHLETKFERLLYDWIAPLGILGAIVLAVIYIVRLCS